jgi:hypothetical protein
MAAPFVMITTHRVPPDRLHELESVTRAYLDHVEANEPRAQLHTAYLDDDGSELTLVQVHPDAASAEHHMHVARDLIGQGLALVDTIGVEVYGEPGPLVRQALEHNRRAGVPVIVKGASWGGFTSSGAPASDPSESVQPDRSGRS